MILLPVLILGRAAIIIALLPLARAEAIDSIRQLKHATEATSVVLYTTSTTPWGLQTVLHRSQGRSRWGTQVAELSAVALAV